MTARAVATALVVLTVGAGAAAMLSGNDARNHTATAAAPDLNSLIHGAPLQRARCSNWLAASQAEKDLAVRALQAVVGGPTEYKGYYGSSLSRRQAYELFDQACSQRVARGFLLYGLYVKQAGFRGKAHPPPPDL
jgi:hypothetical protein